MGRGPEPTTVEGECHEPQTAHCAMDRAPLTRMKSTSPLLSLGSVSLGAGSYLIPKRGSIRGVGQYFHQTLKEKRDRLLQTKLKDRRATLDSCTVTVQTQARVRDVPFTVEEEPGMRRPGREWGLVDSQLEEWMEKFPGKELG